jgi:hypothetical protein
VKLLGEKFKGYLHTVQGVHEDLQREALESAFYAGATAFSRLNVQMGGIVAPELLEELWQWKAGHEEMEP